MPSFLNGLSSLGAGVAQFSAAAGLEAQKADLMRQSLVLSDQLATTRESAGRQEAGQIAATAAEKQNLFLGTQGDLNRQTQLDVSKTSAGATLGAAGIQASATNAATAARSADVHAEIAAADPLRQQQILDAQQKTLFEKVQTDNAQALQTAHTALQTETGKPDADPTKIAALKSQVTSLETSASTEAATTTAAAAMYRTDMDSVQHYNTQLVTATAALNSPDMSDTDRTAQKGLIADLKTQLTGAQRALAYSSSLVHGRVGAQTGTPAPGPTTNRPPLASFGGGAPLPNPNAGPRAVPPPTIPGLGFLNNGASP
jgi:hypothetical protein